MAPSLSAMVWGVSGLLIVGAVLLYVGAVTAICLTKGLRYRPPFDWRDPLCAAANLLIWAGVKSVSAIVSTAKALYEMFSEASAELSEMVLGQRSARVQAAIWSRLRHSPEIPFDNTDLGRYAVRARKFLKPYQVQVGVHSCGRNGLPLGF